MKIQNPIQSVDSVEPTKIGPTETNFQLAMHM